jgi:hypothetical protein
MIMMTSQGLIMSMCSNVSSSLTLRAPLGAPLNTLPFEMRAVYEWSAWSFRNHCIAQDLLYQCY